MSKPQVISTHELYGWLGTYLRDYGKGKQYIVTNHNRPVCKLTFEPVDKVHSDNLSRVTRVEVVDGYGRTYASHQADYMRARITDDGRTLRIVHDGDTQHGTSHYSDHVRED